jgi:FHA domain
MATLDDLHIRVVPGDGLVMRAAGLVAVAFPSGPEHHDLATRFLEAMRAAAGQPDAGRRAARATAGLLAAADDAPPLGLVGTDTAGVAVLLHGEVEFDFRSASGENETLAGRDAATWVDRILDHVPEQWSLARDGAGAADEWSDLQAGVLRGDGVAAGGATITPTPAPAQEQAEAAVAAAPPMPEPATAAEEPAPAPPAEPVPDTPAVLPGATQAVVPPPAADEPEPVPDEDFVAVSLLEPEPDEEPAREPLPVAGADQPPPPPAVEEDEPEVPVVHGVMCKRGHFNDPNSPFCAICGISMVQQTHNLVEGPRPPLGVIVLDDGSTYVVDREIVVGREPTHAPEVAEGRARGIELPDPERSISRVHARVHLHDWEVHLADEGSANGTYVATRDATQWTPVPQGSPVPLTPGMHVLIGQRVLSFDSHRRG